MSDKYVQANGINIHYEEFGTGTPLILLHGGTSTLEEWKPLLPSFTPHFHVYALDSRGHGKTDNPLGRLSYRTMAEDVAAFIRALDISRPLVCGYSDGGQIVLELAMRYPGLTKALVIGAAWYKFSEQYVTALKRWGVERPGEYDFDWVQAKYPHFVDDWKTHHHPDDPEYWKSLILQISEMWLNPLNYTEADFKQIADPILILIGDRDGMVPLEDAFEMYQMIASSELAVLPNADHLGVVTNPETFIHIVLDFLMRQSKSKASGVEESD
jgi:pimeloyl-ACP methyl ester carboxylesterase